MKHTVWLAIMLLFTPSIPAQRGASSASEREKASTTVESQKAGERLYLQRCALCHAGTPPLFATYGPPLDQQLVKNRGDEWVRKFIVEGSSRMPAFRYTLDEAQVTSIIEFLKTHKDAHWR